MTRYRSRSRSPAPNATKRRRDDERYEGRTRIRSRSRSRDRRDYYDRDRDRQRDRSSDRRRHDNYSTTDDDRSRGGRERSDRSRERSRDRYRNRSADRTRDSRDYHRRDRERDRDRDRDRDRRDRNRDRDRDRKDRDGKSNRGSRHDSPATPTTPAALTEEEKKQQRQEKLEAWKKKRAGDEEAKKNAPITMRTDPTTSNSQTASPPVATPPRPEAEKALPNGTSVVISQKSSKPSLLSTASAPISDKEGNLKADKVTPELSKPLLETSSTLTTLPTNRAVSGFGFKGAAKKAVPDAKGKRSLDFDDEESSRKKLERLPSPIPEDSSAVVEEQAEDGDDDVDMQDDSEEAIAAAARAAIAAREERMQIDESTTQVVEQKPMEDAPGESQDDEDVDPLDAFMSNMADDRKPMNGVSNGISQPEAIFGDDEVDLTTIENDPEDILAMASKMKKKKELPSIDHAKVKYDPFRKNFYVEPAELQQLSEQEVDDIRLEMDGIKIRGVDCPKPVQKWSSLGLPALTYDIINKLGYEKPTSIQSQAIPAIMSGRNVIGVAKTGSGKTMAFLLPMFRHIKDQRPVEALDGPVGLIMTPTRELATQILKECKPFLKALGLRGVCAYGGSPIKDQIAELKRGAEFIVCTPGRMIDLLAANSGRVTNLKRVTYVVLDEADRMFDMGFEPQVMKIIGNIRPDRQTVLFSATFPKQMEALARKVLIKPVEITVGGRSVVAPEVTQIVEVRAEDTKFVRLLELLGELYDKDEDARTLIFVDRQEAADTLLKDLMRRGYPCMSIHGSKDQIDRDSAISDFKAGVIPILVATSVAARGLDVKQLKLVVNYDCPNHMEDYVHRVGRTGRAGNKGTAITFITTEQERYANDIVKALKASGQDVPQDVQALVDGFGEKIKAGKEKTGTSGFGGKGLDRLDQERESARKRERRAYGEEGVEAEEPAEAEGDVEEIVVKSSAAPTTPVTAKGPSLDDKIIVHRREDAAGGASNILDKVKLATSAIHKRLNKTGQLRTGVPIDNKGPDAGAFHATLEINDFPQKARWAVTNRTNIAKVLEATGTSITTKGSFYAAGKTPDAGQDPKLYILVEGDTELVVTSAMRELKRLLAEGTAAAVDSENRAPASARYSVL